MSVKLDKKVVELINDKDTVKVVASVGKLGVVNAAIKQSVRVNKEGKVEFLEFLESSDTNRNLIHSLWFEHNVSILLLGKNKESYELRGIPSDAVIEGPYFQENYVDVQKKHEGRLDLATVWVVDITEVRDKNPYSRAIKEQEDYPIIGHLDKFAR